MGDQDGPNSSPATSPTDHTRRRSGSGFQGRSTRDNTKRPNQQLPLIGSPPSSAITDPETMTSPQTPSKRTEHVFPISSVVNHPPTPRAGAGPTEPLRSTSSSGRWSASTPTPYVEHANPFDGDKLYVNFNEELDRQRQFKEREGARFASAQDTSGAQNAGALKHPMTMRFEHKETAEGHCIVTVC